MESFGIAFGFIQFQSRGALTEKSPIRSGPMYLKSKKNESKWHNSQKGGWISRTRFNYTMGIAWIFVVTVL